MCHCAGQAGTGDVANGGCNPQSLLVKITCPSCAAEYNVPDTLAAGRVVRCAKCGNQWAPVAAAVPDEPIVADAAPEPTATAEPPPPPPELPERLVPPAPVAAPGWRRRPSALLLAWLGSALVIVAAVAAGVVFREPVMRAWPPSQRVYGVLHLRAPASPDVHGDVVK